MMDVLVYCYLMGHEELLSDVSFLCCSLVLTSWGLGMTVSFRL